jgi:ammonium transporter Rh
MSIIELTVYAFNEAICVEFFGAVDMGGSIYVHTFGAYFGLAVSKVLSPPKDDNTYKNCGGNYNS